MILKNRFANFDLMVLEIRNPCQPVFLRKENAVPVSIKRIFDAKNLHYLGDSDRIQCFSWGMVI